MADISFAAGYLATVILCNSGASVAVVNNVCEDGTVKTEIEFRIVTAENCTTEGDRACWKHVVNLFEVRRDGILLAVVPASILTAREREWSYQLFMNSGVKVPK